MNTSIERSRNGHEVLYVDGKATASTIDPIKEANAWVASIAIDSIGADETIIILGAGSGFHLAAIRSRFANRIVVIDTCQISIDFVQSRYPEMQNVRFIAVPAGTSFADFFKRSDVIEWAMDPFTILRHRSTMIRNPSLGKIEECLVGRTVEAFRAQLEARPTIASALNGSRLKKLAEVKLLTNGLVSVRDLTSVWEVASEASSERRLLRVLEELVR